MNSRACHLSRQYTATLGRYLEREEEELLQQAYEMGRRAIARGLGVLEMARIHQQALAARVLPVISTPSHTRVLKAAETFFMEALSPFEATHRGFREANLRLQQLNTALATSNAELRNEVVQRERTERALRSLSSRIFHAQEEERKRISRELHDAVGGSLTGINVNLTLLRQAGFTRVRAAQQRIADTQRLLQETMNTVHDFARELRPAALDDLGLVPALRSYLNAFAERTGVRAHLEASDAAEELNGEQKTVVFRIAQESLTNVAKHARASEVNVALRKRNHGIQVEIRDNGQAFRVGPRPAVNGKERLGLLGMEERVRLVNGRFAVKSAPGEGTTVQVDIPFQRGSTSRTLFQGG